MNIKQKIDEFGLVKYVVENGGEIRPLIVPSEFTKGTGLLVNIRHINYTLYHSEKKKFQHQYGPLQYLHPENDQTLTTFNYLCELDESLNISKVHKVDTSQLDVTPLWEFIGLEDARLINWDNKLYLCGVRRDTTTNGQGRMELSEIDLSENAAKEIFRFRIPAPGNDASYCEKNWMPIVDLPYHFVKWTNPTEVVKVDLLEKTCKTVVLDESKFMPLPADLRGGSQVVTWGDYYLTITHEVNLFNSELGRKDGTYRHRFVVWDKDWNIVKLSSIFNFLTGEIEFCAGATFYNGNLLVSFGFQDNSSFLLKIPETVLINFIQSGN